MPGIVMTNRVGDPERSWLGQPSHEALAVGRDSGPGVNGQVAASQSPLVSLPNGQPGTDENAGKHGTPTENEEEMLVATATSVDQGDQPPEIEHITFGYQRLGKLASRLVQTTFNDLTNVLETMAAMTASRPNPVNGRPVVNGDAGSPANVEKKMRLMKFSQDRRAQFIKLLVLSAWSRQSAQVSKVIDLKIWLDKQMSQYDEAGYWLGDLKRSLGPAKLPNPDLRTSLEVLTTGKASWMPKLGYIPLTPLTPQEMLKVLHNMNVHLHIRLNLHETVPAQMKSFTIESGRVTFHVPTEFEVELSVADEDPKSQFFFIDFRFLFSPGGSIIPQGRLRDEFEGRINDILKREGLTGCFNFLHELVLTHKITTLRRQAYKMSRSRWAGSIRLEPVRRSLVVQYWVNRPGRKSWIEVGISSGRQETGRNLEPSASRITIRWLRDGKEVHNAPIKMQLERLNMEDILRQVIALHSIHLLTSIRQNLLETRIYGERALHLKLSKSSTKPEKCKLLMQLTASSDVLVQLEPVTGNFALSPPSRLSYRAELELNHSRDPSRDALRSLLSFRCLKALDEIERQAMAVGWKPWKTLAPRQEDARRVFSKDTLRVAYLRRIGWDDDWIVGVSIGGKGEAWSIIEVQKLPTGYTFGAFQQIPTKLPTGRALQDDAAFDWFMNLATVAASMITQFVNMRDYALQGIKPSIHSIASDHGDTHAAPMLQLPFSSLIAQSSNRRWKPWAREEITLKFKGVSLISGEVTLVAKGTLLAPIPQLEIAKDRPEDEISFHPTSGAFAFRLITRVGQSVVAQLRERLLRIERLISFKNIIRRFQLKSEAVSLSYISFIYAAEQGLQAELRFAHDSPMSLSFAKGNPHLRIQDFLTTLLRGDGGLEHVIRVLGVTLPILQVFDEIERARQDDDLHILPRAADWYQVRYERPRCTFDVRLRLRRDEVKWFVRENDSTAFSQQNRKFTLTEALKTLMDESGDGWLGLRTGIAADIAAIGDVVRGLDQAMRDHADVPQAAQTAQPSQASQLSRTNQPSQPSQAGQQAQHPPASQPPQPPQPPHAPQPPRPSQPSKPPQPSQSSQPARPSQQSQQSQQLPGPPPARPPPAKAKSKSSTAKPKDPKPRPIPDNVVVLD